MKLGYSCIFRTLKLCSQHQILKYYTAHKHLCSVESDITQVKMSLLCIFTQETVQGTNKDYSFRKLKSSAFAVKKHKMFLCLHVFLILQLILASYKEF